MVKLQFPRGPMYGQGKFLYCAFISDPKGSGEDIMFKFQTNNHVEKEVELEAIQMAKSLFKWRENWPNNFFTAYIELIGEILPE